MQASSSTTPRTEHKSERQGRVDMDRLLAENYIDDVDGNIERINRQPLSAPPAPRAKKPAARKPTSSSSKGSSNSTQEDSPSLRKSTRATAGVKRPAPTAPDLAGENEQPPAKKSKRSSPVSTPNTAAATIRKETGRFKPIGSQLKRAKKIESHLPTTDANEATTHDDSGEADVEDAGQPNGPTIKGKAKKTMPKAFIGESDTMGSSLQKPDDAPNDEHWKCANRSCTSGQTWHNRDGNGKIAGFGRKVISNFFGRNKKETNLIHPDVWHNYCRKDYQRGTYRVGIQSAKAKCVYYIDNIKVQLLRIKLWRPQAMFTVQLSKGASTRLANYYKELSKNGNDELKAKSAVTKTAEVNAKGKEKPLTLEEAFPIEYLRHFDDNFCADDQSFDNIDGIVTWLQDLVDHGLVGSMPPMEFLINQQTEDEEIIDPKYNYERWAAYEDDIEFTTPNGSGVDEEVKAEQSGYDSEETELNSNGARQQRDEQELYGLTDDESSEDEETESDMPATPMPPRKRYKLSPVVKGGRPISSTIGAVKGSGLASKRKRDVSDEDNNDEFSETTPSKKPHLGEV